MPTGNIMHLEDEDTPTEAGDGCESWSTMGMSWTSTYLRGEASPCGEGTDSAPLSFSGGISKHGNSKSGAIEEGFKVVSSVAEEEEGIRHAAAVAPKGLLLHEGIPSLGAVRKKAEIASMRVEAAQKELKAAPLPP